MPRLRTVENQRPAALAAGLAAVLATAYAAAPAHADSRRDVIEHLFGASNTNAVAGHGRLTAAVSKDGDVTVLSWPSPSLRDQLAYFSSNAPDARSQPHFGAHDGMGSYVGLAVTTGDGEQVTWLRDAPWTHAQSYADEWAPVPVTVFEHPDLGLTVTITDVVSPDVDALTRRVRVERAGDSPVTAVRLIAYENLSLSRSRIPQLPVGDWAIDTVNGFLGAWDADARAIVHAHPDDRASFLSLIELLDLDGDVDYGPVEELMRMQAPTVEEVGAFVDTLDTAYSPGVAALVTTEPAPASFQVGNDETPLCDLVDDLLDNLLALPDLYPGAMVPLDATTADALRCTDPLPRLREEHGWTWEPEDARTDAADGALSGSPVAAARVNGALATPLAFDGDVAEGSVMFAFGHSAEKARAALATAKMRTAAERQAAAIAAARDALSDAPLPDPDLGERVVEVARRALVNTYVARDREVGAIVASVTRQPPYYLDWPRDGAFFAAGLDAAGFTDWVGQRARWYAGVQRTQFTKGSPLLTPHVPIDPDSGEELFPRYAWEMNYYSDGAIGGPIRFEIDNTALHVWSLAVHAAEIEEPARGAFVDDIWPSTRNALDLLERWEDHETGLPAPANEDDHLELTSKLHGAVTVHAAMEAGARLARYAGEIDRARTYLARAGELRAAILEHYYDPDVGLFRTRRGGEAGPHAGSTAWMVWPGRVLEPDDPRVEDQLVADMQVVLDVLRGDTDREGAQYLAKNILSAGLRGAEDGARQLAREALPLLARVATSDTDHFGEAYLIVGTTDDGLPVWDNRVAPPHVWEGMLFYMAAMAATDRSLFDPDEDALPLPEPAADEPPDEEPPADAADAGCGCRTRGGGGGAAAAVLLLAALARRRHRAS